MQLLPTSVLKEKFGVEDPVRWIRENESESVKAFSNFLDLFEKVSPAFMEYIAIAYFLGFDAGKTEGVFGALDNPRKSVAQELMKMKKGGVTSEEIKEAVRDLSAEDRARMLRILGVDEQAFA